MSTTADLRDTNGARDTTTHTHHDRVGSETKASSKTTELYVYIAAVIAVVVTAMVVGQDDHTHIDPFGAVDAIRYITYLTIGYMLARGLAKSGSRSSTDDDHS